MNRFFKSYTIITIFIITYIFAAEKTGINQQASARRLEELKSDSLNISRILWRIKSPLARKNIFHLLDKIETESKILKPYPVDFYYIGTSLHKYDKKKFHKLSVDALLDSLNPVIKKATILRLNKIDFAKLNSVKTYSESFDNSYVNLTDFPDFQNIDSLRHILLETVLKSDKKSTIEWIWGRSEENDAFYSTKVTAFNGGFSVYPTYRTFIGANKLRNKDSWFFRLESFNPLLQRKKISLTKKQTTELSKQHSDTTKQTISTKTASRQQIKPVVKKEKRIEKEEKIAVTPTIEYDKKLDSLHYDVIYYNRILGSDRHNLDYEKNMVLKEIVDSLSTYIADATILKLDRTDIEFFKSKAFKNINEEYIDLSTIESQSLRSKLILLLSEALDSPNKRRSIEWILGKSKSGYSYYAVVITAFDGQLTIFNEYKKVAGRFYIRDKNSWFNQLKIYIPE